MVLEPCMPVQMSGLSICPIDVETFHEINENFDLMVALKEKVRGSPKLSVLKILTTIVAAVKNGLEEDT